MADLDTPLAVSRVRQVDGPALASVRVVFVGGARSEAVPAVCCVAGRLLEEGTRRRTWRQLAERVEARGMDLVAFGDYDLHGVAVDSLASDVDRALELAHELVAGSNFPPVRCDWVRLQEEQALRSIAESPEAATGWAFVGSLYGEARRARPLQHSVEALRAVDAEDCRTFHTERVATGAIVAVAGAVDTSAVERRLAGLFGSGVTPRRGAAATPPASSGRPTERWVETGSSDQAHVYVGRLTVTRRHPDFLPLVVVATVLGGGAGNAGRIPRRIRESLGLAYSTFADTVAGAGDDLGYLVAYAGASPDKIDEVRRALVEELERIAAEPISRSEFDEACAYLLGREPFGRETGRQWAERLALRALYGLPEPEIPLRERLAVLTPERVAAAAKQHLDPRQLQIVIGQPGSLNGSSDLA